MSSVDSISANLSLNSYSSIGGTQIAGGPAGPDIDNDHDGGRTAGAHNHHGGHAFMNAIFQALGQLGLTSPTQGATTPNSSDVDSDGDNDHGAGHAQLNPAAKQALHAFMHDVFQALKTDPASASTTGTATSPTDGTTVQQAYSGDMNSRLSSLIASLNGNSSSAGGATDQLKSDFSKLVQALRGGSTTGATSNTVTTATSTSSPLSLQSFLQTVVQDLSANAANSNATGNIVDHAA
jgi:hypothetical protein